MKILSYHSGSKWITNQPTNTDDASYSDHGVNNSAKEEIKRVLSDCFRCNNLVILTGLGTSLYVNTKEAEATRRPQDGKKIAPTMRDLWEKARRKSDINFDRVIGLAKFPKDDPQFSENIEALLSYCKVGSEYTDDSNDQALIAKFITDTESIIRDEVDFLADTDDVRTHAELLRKIARRSSRKVRTKIFTTNYDLCFDFAARQGRYVMIDGFSHTNPQVFDSIYFTYDIVRRDTAPDAHDFITNVFHLYKLHGSIDWEKNGKTNEIQRVPKTKNPILIYPRNTKYELAFSQPYIEMMSAFQTAIRQPDTALLVLGFGFNDNHIAEPILSAIWSNLNLKVVICDPALAPSSASSGTAETNMHLRKLAYLIRNGDARLSLINGTFQEVVPELPDIAAVDDLEKHMDRIRSLREI